MSEVGFDALDQEGGFNARPKKALWEINLDAKKNEKQMLEWLNGELEFLQDQAEPRLTKLKRHLALYKGVQYQSQESRTDMRDRVDDRSRITRKIVANHLFDIIANRVARLVKFKPAVSVLPTNNEFADKIAAKSTKLLLDHIWYLQQFEGNVAVRAAKMSSLLGEAYLFITWDKDAGDVSTLDKQARDESEKRGMGRKIRLLDEHGKQMEDNTGKPLFVEKEIMNGDVCYEVDTPFNVLLEHKHLIDDVNFCFRKRIKPVAELRALYPDKAKDIKGDDQSQIFNFEKMETEPARDRVVVWEFWHKRIPMMKDGRYIKFTKTAVLESEDFPFSHKELPFERLTDIDLIGELHANSIVDVIKGLTGSYNNLTNMILRNQIMVSHPKWMVPAGSVKKEQLGNDITIVQYKGPTAPTLAQANPTGAETFEFRKELKEEFQQISGVFGVSRGEPPQGIKAGVALQFLAEQENERFNENVLKHNEWIRRVSVKTLSVAGDKYHKSDKRLLRVLGKDNEWMSVFFKTSNLSKPYDIRIQNSSALPQSKAARLQTLLDLSDRFPDRVDPDQILDMIDMAQSDKFLDIATVSVKSAEAENEGMMEGDINEPEVFEDLIQHWKIHVRHLQQFSYKNMAPDEVKKRYEDHIRATELLIWEKAQKNPFFGQKAALLDLYPIFFEQPQIQPQLPVEGGMGVEPTDDPQRAAALQAEQAGVNPQTGQPVNPQGGSVQSQSGGEKLSPSRQT